MKIDNDTGNGGNYLDLLHSLAAAGTFPSEPVEVMVAHDDWCELLKTGGLCNCEPTVAAFKPTKA